jgi:hypothetical protein
MIAIIHQAGNVFSSVVRTPVHQVPAPVERSLIDYPHNPIVCLSFGWIEQLAPRPDEEKYVLDQVFCVIGGVKYSMPDAEYKPGISVEKLRERILVVLLDPQKQGMRLDLMQDLSQG